MRELVIVFWHYQMGNDKDMHLFIELLMKNFSIEEVCHYFNFSMKQHDQLCAYRQEYRDIKKIYDTQSIRLLTFFDDHYPESLKAMHFPPLVLSYKGNIGLLSHKRITFVAENELSFYAEQVIDDMVSTLKGKTIVASILFDSTRYLYDYANKNGIRSILVLGSSFDKQYPLKHLFLENHAYKTGLVICEYPLNVPFRKTSLLRHRQLLVGLSSVVCVLECSKKSSHLLNAYVALEQNKEVVVPPHNLFEDFGNGGNSLIQEGARIYLCATDLQEALDDAY
ncbi:DNA-protecting protein DprA [Carnobacteriaceae bacterium zg-C25]|nr:DNA-protecting protein DprA [Carnobacteriaceae bacterium zg-ZUI240]QTU83360.1 DNA-protecting protein DprA [Carnobacteriaceae bacterium zg-C25]